MQDSGITKEMEVFIGKKTSGYLIQYLEKRQSILIYISIYIARKEKRYAGFFK